MISLFIMGFLVLVGLASFTMTSNLFQESLLRQSTENQIRAVKSLMERDFALTNGWFVSTVERRNTNSRDALCMPTVDDWQNPANFRMDNGRPAWNRYVVWYANNAEKGLLVRQVVAPSLPDSGYYGGPYAELLANLSETSPLSNAHLVFSQELTQDVVDFEVVAGPGTSTAQVRLKLLSSGTRRGAGAATVRENVEVFLKFDLKNTWPRI